MDNELFIKLLSQHNRLIIPSFGTFLKKEQAGNSIIVFTPFLKTDDGVLRNAIVETLGVEDEEANVIINEYVSVIKSCLEKNGKFYMEELGTLKHDMNGALSFVYEPHTVKAEPKIVPQPILVEEQPIVNAAKESVAPPIPRPTPPPAPRPAPVPQPMAAPSRPLSAPAPKNPLAAPPTPRPIYKRPASAAEQQSQQQRQRPPVKKANTQGKALNIKNLPKMDIWLLVAIVAAILVIILIIYGYMNQDPEILLNPEVETIVDSVNQVVR